MASLKDLKNRIGSVKSTQKITKAMKMVAASKLRRAREAAEAARPYASKMEHILQSLAKGVSSDGPLLMSGTGKDKKHLIIVAMADRGLCGGFNVTIAKAVRAKVSELLASHREVGLFFVGSKARDLLGTEFNHLVMGEVTNASKKGINYDTAQTIAENIASAYEHEGYDVCHIVYNQFESAISQKVRLQQLIPLSMESGDAEEGNKNADISYDYEPDEEAMLDDLIPRNLAVQIFCALLENAASEQGARMTAMDNATRNAGDMINRLTLQYNRSRQAAITKELIEIISGAEAL